MRLRSLDFGVGACWPNACAGRRSSVIVLQNRGAELASTRSLRWPMPATPPPSPHPMRVQPRAVFYSPADSPTRPLFSVFALFPWPPMSTVFGPSTLLCHEPNPGRNTKNALCNLHGLPLALSCQHRRTRQLRTISLFSTLRQDRLSQASLRVIRPCSRIPTLGEGGYSLGGRCLSEGIIKRLQLCHAMGRSVH